MYDEPCKESDEYKVFIVSTGWLYRFMNRYGLSLRRATISQHDPQNLIDKIVSYIIHIRRIQKQHGYKAENIISMDATAVWADIVSDTTVNDKGTACF